MIRFALTGALSLLSVPAQALPEVREQRLLEAVEKALRAHYVYPEKTEATMIALRAKASTGVYRGLDEKAFAKALSADLREAGRDGHFQVRYFPEGMPKDERGQDDPAVVAEMHREGQQDNWGIRSAEARTDGIGVLRIDQFYALADSSVALESALQMLRNSSGIVLDLRTCRGGEPETVARLLSHFLPAGTKLNSFYGRGRTLRSATATTALSKGVRSDRPLTVLTTRRTASACEELAYDLKALKRATIVGERTFGAANPGEMVPLDSHFAMFVPDEFVENAVTGGNWEGTGVAPDVEAQADTALDVAIRLTRPPERQSPLAAR